MRNLMNDLVAVIALARSCSRVEAARWLKECVRKRETNMAESELEPWETDADCWLDGHRLLLQLRDPRYNPEPGAGDEAERTVRSYCRLLRRSPDCTLARIQKEYRVPDEALVVRLYAFAGCMGICPRSLGEAIILGWGFDPSAYLVAWNQIACGRGYGRLFEVSGENIWPSRTLWRALRRSPWTDDEARRCREEIAKLPTIPFPELRKRKEGR